MRGKGGAVLVAGFAAGEFGEGVGRPFGINVNGAGDEEGFAASAQGRDESTGVALGVPGGGVGAENGVWWRCERALSF